MQYVLSSCHICYWHWQSYSRQNVWLLITQNYLFHAVCISATALSLTHIVVFVIYCYEKKKSYPRYTDFLQYYLVKHIIMLIKNYLKSKFSLNHRRVYTISFIQFIFSSLNSSIILWLMQFNSFVQSGSYGEGIYNDLSKNLINSLDPIVQVQHFFCDVFLRSHGWNCIALVLKHSCLIKVFTCKSYCFHVFMKSTFFFFSKCSLWKHNITWKYLHQLYSWISIVIKTFCTAQWLCDFVFV